MSPTPGSPAHAQGNTLAGRLAEPKLNGDTTATILLNEALGSGIIYSNIAASSAVTTTTTETLFDTNYAIPANSLKPGDVMKMRYQGIVTAQNSTDTLTIKAVHRRH
jgi:hypothetical protein